MTSIRMSLDEVGALAATVLEAAGASPHAAASVARSTVRAERNGIRSHGLLYIPIYAEHLRCGKVAGQAVPKVWQTANASIRVDAGNGFAHPAIDAGWSDWIEAARTHGMAALTLHHSYNCGVLGHHAERVAEAGLLGLCFTHAPASIAPVGGSQPVIGTNPIALGVPDGRGGVAILIDQSASTIAKSEILLRSRNGEALEPGWALDGDGNPMTDATAALKGTMTPAGGYKGFGIGLIVEVLASCLAGAVLSRDASPFSGSAGGPPDTGQCFIAFDPKVFSGDAFGASIDRLVAAISDQPGARIPGHRRKANRQRIEQEGVAIDPALMERLTGLIR